MSEVLRGPDDLDPVCSLDGFAWGPGRILPNPSQVKSVCFSEFSQTASVEERERSPQAMVPCPKLLIYYR